MRKGRGAKSVVKGGNTPILARKGGKGSVEVTFEDPDMARMVGISLNASRYIPKEIKDILVRRELYDDVIQCLYMSMVEYWRTHQFRHFADGGEKSRYKQVVRFTWRSLYRMLREYIPEYKRYHFDQFMDPSRFVNVVDPGPFDRAFSKERELVKMTEGRSI